jgi:hypothetical protein
MMYVRSEAAMTRDEAYVRNLNTVGVPVLIPPPAADGIIAQACAAAGVDVA